MRRAEPTSLRELRRGQIIAAARTLVAEGGVESLTFAALEARLDFTRGVMTHHFRNKDEILDSLLRDAVDEIDEATLAAALAASTPEGRILAVVEGMTRGFLEHREATAVLLSFWTRLRADPRVASMNAGLYRHWRARSATLLRGLGVAEERVEPLAALLVGIVIGTVTQVLFEEGAVDAAGVALEAAAAVRAVL